MTAARPAHRQAANRGAPALAWRPPATMRTAQRFEEEPVKLPHPTEHTRERTPNALRGRLGAVDRTNLTG
jgi:hypothetical protein